MPEGDPAVRDDAATCQDAGRERRMSARYASNWSRAWLGWHGTDGFRSIPCWLQDISTGGCQIGVHEDAVPESALIRLDGEWLARWYDVRVIEARPAEEPGFSTVRARFPGGCPYELFMAVAFGMAAARVAAVEAPTRESPPEEPAAPRVSPREGRHEAASPGFRGFAFRNRGLRT